jgi:pilus assembly protein CpaB
VLATPTQALLLTKFENEGVLHAALICRGNETLAEDLLGRQDDILVTLYGDGSTDEELTSSLTPEMPVDTPDTEETAGAAEDHPAAAE